MVNAPLLRLLDLVREDLGAQDARLEIGGLEPTDNCCLWHRLPGGSRLVLVFPQPLRDREELLRRLTVWVDSFEGLLSGTSREPVKPRATGTVRRLGQELARLVARAGAMGARVIDVQSPEIWATFDSNSTRESDSLLEQATERVRAEDRGPRLRKYVSEPGLAFVARGFAGIYRLILVYDGPFSELQAEAALNAALPRIERLVLALPPTEPPGRGRPHRLALVPPRPRHR